MIAASRRRRGTGRHDLRLHLALARRSATAHRLRRGAAGALIGSVVALFLGVGTPLHLAAIVVGAAAGAALPVRGERERALRYIGGRAGLSYETSLALEGSTGDEFGLAAAVRERAALSIRDVRPEPLPAWWLPLTALACGLLLFNGDIGVGGAGVAGPSASGTVAGGSSGEEAPEATPPPAEPEDAAGLPDDVPDRAETGAPGAGNEADRGDEQGVDSPGGSDSSSAPLGRFLEGLRERPPEDPAEPGGAQTAGGPGAEPPDAAGREGEGAQRAELPVERSGEGSGEESGPEAGVPEGAPQESGAEPGDSDGEPGGGAGDEMAAGQEAEPGDEAGAGPGEEDAGAVPDAGGGEETAGDGDTQAGVAPDEGGDDPADGGGVGAGGGAESDAGIADSESEDLELLPGVLGQGEENPAGAVRLPGRDDVFLPPGVARGDYTAAAEEALTEGDLPLAYQEVVRRYFR